ncbi:hypothetical protein [Paracoccus tegillarcae]|uniref:Uncharacterized protein n=1 Tax=Paracoccus tegillarcae TaxID=1529068 RepID=A0A2K9EGW8_9RHOB|nr:hypothetical protein [Paracoccus tegillarcae]AUH32567.1 hypothetical protein CUV01_03490 [Paracoccus tegillarcae]
MDVRTATVDLVSTIPLWITWCQTTLTEGFLEGSKQMTLETLIIFAIAVAIVGYLAWRSWR